jgi:hypothetical protein
MINTVSDNDEVNFRASTSVFRALNRMMHDATQNSCKKAAAHQNGNSGNHMVNKSFSLHLKSHQITKRRGFFAIYNLGNIK